MYDGLQIKLYLAGHGRDYGADGQRRCHCRARAAHGSNSPTMTSSLLVNAIDSNTKSTSDSPGMKSKERNRRGNRRILAVKHQASSITDLIHVKGRSTAPRTLLGDWKTRLWQLFRLRYFCRVPRGEPVKLPQTMQMMPTCSRTLWRTPCAYPRIPIYNAGGE